MPFPELFERKRDHCRRLLALSRQQASLIAAEDYTALLEVLAEKQALLGRLDRLKSSRAAEFHRWTAEREHLDPASRARCESLLEETENLIAELLREEQASTDSLVERRRATRDELAEVSGGTRVNDAYRDSLAPTSHRHLDLDT